MRKRKFRGQVRRKKGMEPSEWVYGDGIIAKTPSYSFINRSDRQENCIVFADTIGQYIGFNDLNGKEIYEGDIVKVHQFYFDGTECEHEFLAVIEYMDSAGCFGANVINTKQMVTYTKYLCEDGKKVIIPLNDLYELHDSIEIIGNIYDNPELL